MAPNTETDKQWLVWYAMRRRCTNPKDTLYSYYGGRGITICERWAASYASFLEDMGERPTPDHQIDRIDNNGPYSPDNCRWATRLEQGRNKRNNVYVLWQGQSMTIADASRASGVPRARIAMRLRRGWPPDRAVAHGTWERRPEHAAKSPNYRPRKTTVERQLLRGQ